MDFRELCQMVARESGTVSGAQPLTVVAQTGRLGKIVFWTAEAWRQIQNRRSRWFWMEGEFDGETAADTARYTATSFSLDRWSAWIRRPGTLTIYLESLGVSDERELIFMPWDMYRRTYDRGTQTSNYPVHYAISPAGELCFGPIPDDVYIVQGIYRKSPQTLEADGDIPEMPEQYHDLIAWDALQLLAEHDEGEIQIAVAVRRSRELKADLERDQLPQMELPDALA